MLICAHCGSQSIVHDMEYVAGKGWIEEPRCLKCGRMQFKTAKQEKQNLEINKIINSGKTEKEEKEEKDMGLSTTGKCEACGVRNTVAGYLCPECFQARHGITVQEYKDNKRYRTETPAKVAARITGKVIEKPAPTPAETKQPIRIFLDPELLDALMKAAKKNYRTTELHAAYLIDRGLQSE